MNEAMARAISRVCSQMKQSHSPPQHAQDQSSSVTAQHSDAQAAGTGTRAAELAQDSRQTQMEEAQSWPLLLTMHRAADEAPASLLGRQLWSTQTPPKPLCANTHYTVFSICSPPAQQSPG